MFICYLNNVNVFNSHLNILVEEVPPKILIDPVHITMSSDFKNNIIRCNYENEYIYFFVAHGILNIFLGTSYKKIKYQ